MTQVTTNLVAKSKGYTCIPNEIMKLKHSLKSLDLSLNQINSIEPSFSNFSLLTLLRLRGNNINKFPDPILDLQSLKCLDLSNNHITSIPPNIVCLNNLSELIMGQNNLTSLPKEIGIITTLVNITLPANNLKELPLEMCSLTKLTFVDLSNNNFDNFPQVLGKLSNIRTLWMFYNNLNKLKGIEGIKHLNQLKLLHNKFTQIPKQIFNLTELCSLELDNNLIRKIPPEIKELKKLKEIAFTDCLIQRIPEEIVSLSNLQELVIVRSRVNEFPRFLRKMPKISNLIITDSLITEVSCTLNNCCIILENNKLTEIKCTPNDNVFTLNLCNNHLKKIPNTTDLQTIHELYLTNNFIQQIEQTELHSNLKILTLASNKLTSFPEKGISYNKLKELNLSNNGISQLPNNLFTFLPYLKILKLGINQLTTIPTSLGILNQLEELNLSHNKLTEFPLNILKLTSLTNLYLTHNYICDLPKNLSQLNNLQVVDFSSNNIISALPLIKCTTIKSLSMAFNKNLHIPSELTLMKQLKNINFIGTLPEVKYPLNVNFIKQLNIFEISCFNTEKRDRNKPQTIIHTPLLFLKSAYCNQLKLPLSSPQFEENSFECPVEIGISNMCGKRDSMQDTSVVITNFLGIGFHLLSLFDGHSGIYSSCFCASQFPNCFANILSKNPQQSIEDALIHSFKEMNQKINEYKFNDGTAANVVLITPQRYFIANVGDSRCILVKKDSIIILNEDHTINNPDEVQRIRKLNGFIDHSKVNGEIVLTRTLGDIQCSSVCSCIPQITCHERGIDDICIVLCCDGVFDVLSNELVGEICRKKSNESASVLSSLIRDIAYNNGCKDNISCIVCKLMS
ncbi:leucine-rich repeat containing protein [Entamoeba histolytica HM-3:IMSS]|uniref:Leucine rich repeat protein phosphatase 2c domain containing protein n=3 Tax=Entamoeba histolytica TaxID=5759 RepID=A0A175JT85_ENTHI|nr:leucinerich repeat-containing protein [Entamoeba histolytica KU27]EMS16028.1 leucine-rich repeat containing protein [Entamoeba histolytica HM-3:IMSS]GAT96980.1 leucine rich repeat protein phosphatase 2c domain containing protein [Entamoeba histolytica]